MFDLSLEVLRVVEDAAIASARTMGWGDSNASDHAAVESMRRSLDTLPIQGVIVIAGRRAGTKRPCFTSAKKWAEVLYVMVRNP